MQEGVLDEEDQELPVQELILIDRSMSKLVMLQEKIDMLIEKNDRLLNKAILKIKSESLQHKCESLLKEIVKHGKHSSQLYERIKAQKKEMQ